MKYKLIGLFMFLLFSQSSLGFADTIESKIEEHGTSKYLEVRGLSAKVKDNLLTIHLQIKNKDNNDNRGYYRVRWLDQEGDPVWDEEQWKPLLLHGNQKLSLKIVAPTPKARDFKIELSAEENYRE